MQKLTICKKKMKFNDADTAEGFFKLTTWDVESTFAISPMTMDTLTFKGEASLPTEKEIRLFSSTEIFDREFFTFQHKKATVLFSNSVFYKEIVISIVISSYTVVKLFISSKHHTWAYSQSIHYIIYYNCTHKTYKKAISILFPCGSTMCIWQLVHFFSESFHNPTYFH